VVPPNDPERSAERVLDLLRSPDIREEMGRAGRRYVEERYSRSRIGDRYHALLETVAP